jgi:hypothetical protein
MHWKTSTRVFITILNFPVPKKVEIFKPAYIAKPDYGKVPEYLSKRTAAYKDEKSQLQVAMTQHEKAQILAAQMERGVVPLPEEERMRVLEGLQYNWEKLNSDYQKLSLTVDTVPKISRYGCWGVYG